MNIIEALQIPYKGTPEEKTASSWLRHWEERALQLGVPLGDPSPRNGRRGAGQVHRRAVYHIREMLKTRCISTASIPMEGFHRVVLISAATGKVISVHDGVNQLAAHLDAFEAAPKRGEEHALLVTSNV